MLSNPTYVDALHRANEADVKLYNYATEVIYPRQLQEYADEHQSDDRHPFQSNGNRLWPTVKRNTIYKPIAKIRQSLLKTA